jgi:hypothetical protein
VSEVILIKINGNAVYLAREPFGLVSLLLMLDTVTWTYRKIWSLRSAAACVGRWKSLREGKKTREGRYSVNGEGFLLRVKCGDKSSHNFGK